MIDPSEHPDMPPLAQYRRISDYTPSYGDFVIKSGWFTVQHGVVSNYDPKTDEVHIIMSCLPLILFTMSPDEQVKANMTIKLAQIRNSIKGSWAVMQHDYKGNATIWYI